MSKLIPITLVSVLLAMVSHALSGYDHIRNRYTRKEPVLFAAMAVSLVLFCGLRTGYNDTGTYQLIYKATPSIGNILDGIDFLSLGENPGFHLTNRILKRLNFSTQSYIMFYAVITVGLTLWFFRKYSCNLPITIFLYITFAGYIFSLAAIKQCMAMAICMLAVDRAMQKKHVSFVLLVLLASTYHPYSLMYLITPFLVFRPWTGKTVFMLLAFAVAGVGMQFLVGSLLSITDMLGESYDANSFTGEGVNPFRLLVTIVPILVSVLVRNEIAAENDPGQDLILNLTMLNGEIMFIALFGTANYFARLANYFLPFQALALPRLFSLFNPRSRKLIVPVALVCYGLFFIYSQAIHESFDCHFYSMTLIYYIKTLLGRTP